MNIVTFALAKKLKNRRLKLFITHWDELEALVIRVYKAKRSIPEDEAEYSSLRGWLQREYPHWQRQLSEYWPQALAGGVPASSDPYMALLNHALAASFVGDWSAMETLPAASEALNQLLLTLGNK